MKKGKYIYIGVIVLILSLLTGYLFLVDKAVTHLFAGIGCGMIAGGIIYITVKKKK